MNTNRNSNPCEAIIDMMLGEDGIYHALSAMPYTVARRCDRQLTDQSTACTDNP